MGAATVLLSLGTDLPGNVKGVVADCGFTSPWEIVRHVAKRDFHLPAFPPFAPCWTWYAGAWPGFP